MDKEIRNEVEIDLIQLLLLCIRKWKTILLAGVVCALILGGYKGVRGLSQVGSAAAIEADESAEDKLTAYDSTLASYKAQLDRLNETFEKNQAYEQESIIMNMNSNDYYSGSITYYISTDYKIMPDKTYQDVDHSEDITQAYLSYLSSSECLSFVQSKLSEKIPVKYLSELIRVSGTGRVITIKVVGDTSDRTSEILTAVSEAVDSYKKEIDAKIHEHKLDLMEYSEAENIPSSRSVDEGGYNYGSQTQIRVTNGQNSFTDRNYVADFQRQFSDNQNNLTNQIVSIYNNYTALSDKKVSAESGSGITRSQALKSGIKYGIIGLVLGIFVAAGFIVFKAIIEDKINNAGEISYLFGLRIFGDYKSGTGNNAFSKLLYKMSYGDALSDKEKFYQVAAANVKTFAAAFKDEDIKEISMVGRIGSETLKNIVDSVNAINGDETVKAAGDIIVDAEAINAIRDVKNTLIAVDRNTSKKDLRDQLKKLKGLNKSVAGVLLFD